ncbi:MAG: hypothetical protein AAFO58_00690, partial [Pseudomonadota bacterium]
SADGNTDDAVKLSEEGTGDVFADVVGGRVTGNGGKGYVFEEADAGDLVASVTNSESAGNDDSDDTGVEAVQEDDGMGQVTIVGAIADGLDLDGVDQK